MVVPKALFTLAGKLISRIILGKHVTERMRNPHAVSASAQKSRGPIYHMVSASLEKVTVWSRRKPAATHALVMN
jgi:hypothetical protein